MIMGVNIMGAQGMSEQQQDALIEQLVQSGVKTIRTGLGAKFDRFIIRAFEHGIGAVVILYPTEAATGPMRPANPSVGLQWAVLPLSKADPKKFSDWFASQLAPLEAAGVRLAAFELGVDSGGQPRGHTGRTRAIPICILLPPSPTIPHRRWPPRDTTGASSRSSRRTWRRGYLLRVSRSPGWKRFSLIDRVRSTRIKSPPDGRLRGQFPSDGSFAGVFGAGVAHSFSGADPHRPISISSG
jgi:hypothetical protein